MDLFHSIHKNSSKKDPSNYRGITLLSSLEKLFSSLVFNRIENDILSPSKTYNHLPSRHKEKLQNNRP